MVPDLDDLTIAKSHYIYDRNMLVTAEKLHPPHIRLEIPLPASCHKVALSDLIIDVAGHGPSIPEIRSDLLLLLRLLHRILAISDVMSNVSRSDKLVYDGWVVPEPNLFVELASQRFVLLFELSGEADYRSRK